MRIGEEGEGGVEGGVTAMNKVDEVKIGGSEGLRIQTNA